MGPATLTFAARHPERVSHLVLWCAYASGADYLSTPQVQAIRSLSTGDWDLYLEAGAHSFVGWPGDDAHRIALLMREGSTQETARRFLGGMETSDCTPLLEQVVTPTLVIHPRSFELMPVHLARELAAAIPAARLALVEGSSFSPHRCDLEDIIRAVREFLAEPSPAAAPLRRVSAMPTHAPPAGATLTAREWEILVMLARGHSNRDIADALVLSTRTVEHHVANILAKINVNSRTQAVAYALSNGLVAPLKPL